MRALSLSSEKELSIIHLEDPKPGKGEVVVAMKAAALNHREIWITKGLYPGMQLPTTLGSDGAGSVIEIGEGVDDHWLHREVVLNPTLNWGDDERHPTKQFQIMGMPSPGTIATKRVVPVTNLVNKPDHLTWEEAAALPVAHVTAWRGLVRHGQIQEGDNVLITGIGGGVAQAGLALAHQMGAHVYVTSSSQEKINQAISKGAIAGFNYKEEGWNEELAAASGGIDIVLDGALTHDMDLYMRFLKLGARVVVYGATATLYSKMQISRFFLRHVSLIGTAMGSPSDFAAMMEFVDRHKIKPVIASTFDFERAVDAFHALKTSQQIGKIVINNIDNY